MRSLMRGDALNHFSYAATPLLPQPDPTTVVHYCSSLTSADVPPSANLQTGSKHLHYSDLVMPEAPKTSLHLVSSVRLAQPQVDQLEVQDIGLPLHHHSMDQGLQASLAKLASVSLRMLRRIFSTSLAAGLCSGIWGARPPASLAHSRRDSPVPPVKHRDPTLLDAHHPQARRTLFLSQTSSSKVHFLICALFETK